MIRALSRGLSLSDFEIMTVGMILDFIVAYYNSEIEEDNPEQDIRMATQADYDRF